MRYIITRQLSRRILSKGLFNLPFPITLIAPKRYAFAKISRGFRFGSAGDDKPGTDTDKDSGKKKIDIGFIVGVGLIGVGLTSLTLLWYQRYKYQPVFNAPKFTKFLVVSKVAVSPTSFIITLRPESYALNSRQVTDPYMKEWERGTWSVEFKQPQLQIARSYTPLPPSEDNRLGDLRFLIREEVNGEMSRYVARLADGDKLELRGPHTEVELPAGVEDVLFLAGGTGVAPALQVAHTLLEVRNRPAKQALPNIHIVWANRRREDCVGGSSLQLASEDSEGIIVKELRKLQDKFPLNVKVDYIVDEEGTFVNQKMISQLTQTSPKSATQTSRLLFVSGPEGFVNFLAGPKLYEGGRQLQGNLGGLMGKMNLRGWETWKQ